MKALLFLLAIIPMLLVPTVYATGVRHDSGDDATAEEHECWINGYDSGFAGKYDKDRARECVEHRDNYNKMWALGCEDSTRTEEECGDLINSPVEIDDFEPLKAENDRTCYDAGQEDGKADRPFNEDREDGCYEFDDISGGYEGGYQWGCENHYTQATCELRIEGEKTYCPNHPDIAACVPFLQNATNKRTENSYGACAEMGDPRANIICPQESNPERYCLNTNDTAFCRSIGDLCDEHGFVKPEYPYCTTN